MKVALKFKWIQVSLLYNEGFGVQIYAKSYQPIKGRLHLLSCLNRII